jgi:hypothetical protein
MKSIDSLARIILMRRTLLFCILALVLQHLAAADHKLSILAQRLAHTHWISYAPTHLYPAEAPPVYPSIEAITEDHSTLSAARFDGLITYGSNLENFLDLAATVGFRSMVVGTSGHWPHRNLPSC